MKQLFKLVITIFLMGSNQLYASNHTSVTLTRDSFINTDMKTCYGMLNELKKYDAREHKKMNNSLMSVVQAHASLSNSGQFASQEAVNYINAQQKRRIRSICLRIGQKLDEEVVRKMSAASDY